MLIKLLKFLLFVVSFNETFACSIFVSPINFGVYNIYSITDSEVNGYIKIDCDRVKGANPRNNAEISITYGNSGTYASRFMFFEGNKLFYNIYIDEKRRKVWGDGSQGSHTKKINFAKDKRVNIYAAIPSGQIVNPGNYSDNIIITVDY